MRYNLKNWHDYFVKNYLNTGDFVWNDADRLTPEEKQCIEKSIAAFQLGEYSEGKGLLRSAEAFAQKRNNPHLYRITRLFIAEEQNHALLLMKFMNLHGMKLIKKNWTDAVFRRLRKNVGFELSVTVLITAEIISLVYYDALRSSTTSGLLKKICNKILDDEMAHVKYESELLYSMRSEKTALVRHTLNFLHRVLFIGTLVVVYLSHRKVLNRGGYDFTRFAAACWLEFSNCFPSALVVRASANA
jgi:hypothetical protein